MGEGRVRQRASTATGADASSILEDTPVAEELRPGARMALHSCLGVTAGDRFVLVIDWDSDEIAAALYQEARDIGAIIRVYRLGPGHLRSPRIIERVQAALDDAQSSVLLCGVDGMPRDFRRRMVPTRGPRRHGHMVAVTRPMLEQSLRADPEEIEIVGGRLLRRLTDAKTLDVSAPGGTRLRVELSARHRWHHASGRLREPGWTNLPGGEAFTAPLSVDGVLVPDGGVWVGDGVELPGGSKLRLTFAQGALTAVEGGDAAAPFEAALGDEAGRRRVGQVGFGTNIGVIASIGALLQDLKLPGVHFSLGHTVPELTGASFDGDVEIPLLIRRATVLADGVPLMTAGRYHSAIRDLRRED